MKTIKIQFVFFFLWFASIILMLLSCSVRDFCESKPYRFSKGDVSASLADKERDEVFKDTITPPNNPMNEIPIPDGGFAFRGVLSLEKFQGEYYCAVRSVNNNYLLIDEQVTCLMRLDDPRLRNYTIGDTIVITAQPTKILDNFSLITHYIQSANSSSNE